VLTAYRSSHVFQGYLSDNRQVIESIEADYVVFTADDCLVNSDCVVNNVIAGLDREQAAGFFATFTCSLAGQPERSAWIWPHTLHIISRLFGPGVLTNPGVEGWLNSLPDRARALGALGRYDAAELRLEGPSPEECAKLSATEHTIVDHIFRNGPVIELPYPFVRGRADFWIIKKDALRKFLHYCGVFSSLNLWMEVAIPTAAALLESRIIFAKDLGLRFDWDFWNPTRPTRWPQPKQLADLYRMLEEMSEDLVFRHPVKLSAVTAAFDPRWA
jgi:hypothetical protein